MGRRAAKRRVRRWLGYAALGLFGFLLISVVAMWLALERIPGWYKPIDVADADLQRIRNSLPNTYQDISDLVMLGAPFEYSVSEETVTEWIVARADLYPDAGQWLPPWLRDPVVVFDDDKAIIGGRIEYKGWRAIIGIHLVAEITNEQVTVRLERITAGALPIPLSLLDEPLHDLLDGRRLEPELMPDPLGAVVERLQSTGSQTLAAEGVQWRNMFELRNGRRWFKLRGIRSGDGDLTVNVEPR